MSDVILLFLKTTYLSVFNYKCTKNIIKKERDVSLPKYEKHDFLSYCLFYIS